MSTRSVPFSPSISVPSAVIRTSLIGSSFALAIARLSLEDCEPVDVFKNAASSPSRNAAARLASSSLSCSVSFGALVAAGLGFDWPGDWVVEARLVSGDGASLPPQAATSTAVAVTAAKRDVSSSERTMSGFPRYRRNRPPSGANLVV